MSLRDVGKVCLFSGISGVITLDGEPVVNAKVRRIVGRVFTGGKKIDETTTDENGYFEMPAVFQRTISKYLPQEFVAPQQMFVDYNGKEYFLWEGVKREPGENVESRGKPLVVSCELASEEKNIVVDGSFITSVCTWDVEPDKIDTGF